MGNSAQSEVAESPSIESPLPGTVPALISQQAERDPPATCLLAPGRDFLAYADLWELVLRTARHLSAMGFARDDRVALVLPNGPEMAAAFLSVTAVAGCGPLNPAYRSNELHFFLKDMGARAVIVPKDGSQAEARRTAGELGVSIIELEPQADGKAGHFSLGRHPVDSPSNLAWPRPDDVALLLHTSGTTSRPKLVPLTHANLISSATQIAESLQLNPGDRCLNVMPLFHIHGLMASLLASIQAGASIACTPGYHAPAFFEWLRQLMPSWYTAVPTMHQSILARAEQNRDILEDIRLRFIRSSSAALPPRVFRELEDAFHAPVIEAYGMTEASHQMASNPLPPGKRKPGTVGLAAGSEIAIMGQDGHLLKRGEVGEIVIRGPSVTGGYEGNPEANEASFVDGWFRTGDEGYLDSDGYLVLSGRIKEIINKGGEKISPREIDEVMMKHPAVSQAVAFSLPDERLGEDVGLAVVLKEGEVVSSLDLRRFAARSLADFKVPIEVVILDEIPTGPTGKLQRVGLAERLGLLPARGRHSEAPRPHVPPRTPTEQALARLWCDVLGVDRVGVEDRFLDLGGDSLLATLLLSRLQAQMRIEVSMVDFFAAPTVAEQAELIDAILFDELEDGVADASS